MGIVHRSNSVSAGVVSKGDSLILDTSGDGDFVSISGPTRQANILIYGEPKTGKTTFCTRYAPDPVLVLSFDGRSDDAVYDAVTEYGRNVKLANVLMPEQKMSREETKRTAQDLLDRAVFNAEIAVRKSKSGGARTLLVDGLKQFEEICKLALDGTMEKVKEHSHGEDKDFCNRQVWRLANLARKSHSLHIIFTSDMTEIWKDQKPTGRFRYQGPKAALKAVDWAAQIRLKTGYGDPKFELEITSAGTNIDELYEVYDASMWDMVGGPFVYACCMNYKDSVPGDWK